MATEGHRDGCIHLGQAALDAAGGVRVPARGVKGIPRQGLGSQFGGTCIHCNRIPIFDLNATHLQLHLAVWLHGVWIPLSALSGSGWVWPSCSQTMPANRTPQEITSCLPPRRTCPRPSTASPGPTSPPNRPSRLPWL